MKPLTNRSKVVSNKEMTATERLYIPAILSGLKITIKHLFKKKVTIKYPEQIKPRYSEANTYSKEMKKAVKTVQLVVYVPSLVQLKP
jgi:formate hydrogenlyase subunit 6/NADH:ubiquinone oxidoreductase subunit I